MVKLNLAITTICVWLVPHIGIEMAEFRISLQKSHYWRGERLDEAQSSIWKQATIAVTAAILVFTATAIFVALATQDMDQRADFIVVGISLLVSAVLFTLLSVKIPKWLGVYHSSKSKFGSPTGITLKHLQFNLRWSIWRHFAQVYVVMMLQFCNASRETIPVSALIGIVVGLAVFYGVYVGRTKWKAHKKWIALGLAGTISIGASLSLAWAVYYIDTVWRRSLGEQMSVEKRCVIFFFAWLILVCLPLHVLLWRNTKRKVRESLTRGIPHSYRYKTEMFSMKKTSHISPHLLMGYSSPRRLSSIERAKDNDDNNKDNKNYEDGTTEAADANLEHVKTMPTMDRDSSSSSRRDDPMKVDDASTTEGADDKNKPQEAALNEVASEEKTNKCENDETDDNRNHGRNHEYHDNDVEESTNGLDNVESVRWKEVEETERMESTRHLIAIHCCGRAEREGEREPKTRFEMVLSLCKWFISIVINFLFLYIVIVNIGSAQQMEAVRAHMTPAFDVLYPPEYNIGPVCAWSEPTVNGTIQTFDTAQDAYNANYSIVHCGACGSCSSWNDLSLQWTTRTNLADMAQKCAKESFMGSWNDVQTCYKQKVSFTNDCAWCWTEDSKCAKKNCVFIFLQSQLINNIGNFKVGMEHVTSASCDEAMCGPVFVPCSGATRRRMNIVSAIPRPIDQQCHIIKQDWAKVFNHS